MKINQAEFRFVMVQCWFDSINNLFLNCGFCRTKCFVNSGILPLQLISLMKHADHLKFKAAKMRENDKTSTVAVPTNKILRR